MTYNIIRILCKKATSQNSAEEKKGKKKKNPPPSFSVSYLLHIKDVQLQYDNGKERPSSPHKDLASGYRYFC